MRENEGRQPEWYGDEAEKPEQTDGEDGFGNNQVAVIQVEKFADPSPLGCVEDEENAHRQADEGRATSDDERVAKSIPEMRSVKKLVVPF